LYGSLGPDATPLIEEKIMRLTLRTLLAYLDDVLDPSQTREIGDKIRESPRAAALVSRIREAIRKRRLGAPSLDGPGQGLDPNLVAAYLDDSLTPEQVVDIEQVCLDADVQLAEVAACHQILTLLMAENREVPQASLDRYYALGPVPFDERLQVEGGNGAAPRPVAAAAPAATDATADFVARLPDYLKPSPWSQRVAPLAGVALIVILAAVLLAMDRDLFRGLARTNPPDVNVAQNPPAAPGDDVAAAVRPPSPPRGVNGGTGEAPPSVMTETAAPIATLPAGVDPTPPPDAPEPSTAPASASSITNAPAPASASTTPPSTATTATPPAATSAPQRPVPASTTPRVAMNYTSVEGVLLRYEPGDQHWYVHPRRSEVHAEEIFASPEPFEAQFDFDRGGFKVTLLSDAAMEILPSAEAARIGLSVWRGRVVLQPGAKPAAEGLDFALRVGMHQWLLRFSGPEAVCGVEVMPRDPAGLEKAWEQDGQHVAIHVGAGTVQVDPEANEPQSVAAGQRLVLSNAPWPLAPGSDAPATWLDPQRRERGELLKRFAPRFEKEFDPTVASDLTIPALAKDQNPKLTELAARCLALTDQYAALVQTLAESDHEETRAVAAQGLRTWLGQGPDRGALLKRELAGHYPDDEGQTVYRLLWGLTPDDGKDKITSIQTVELLRSAHVEIRELAFQQLVQLTGRKYDYRPSDGASQRERAIQRWASHLQREGGSLIKAE
jgi:hypothetical protein